MNRKNVLGMLLLNAKDPNMKNYLGAVEETIVSFEKYFCVKEERTFKYHIFFHSLNFI